VTAPSLLSTLPGALPRLPPFPEAISGKVSCGFPPEIALNQNGWGGSAIAEPLQGGGA